MTMPRKNKLIIGSALRNSEKAPRFERKDPNPNIPFVTPEKLPTAGEALLFVVAGVILLAFCFFVLGIDFDPSALVLNR